MAGASRPSQATYAIGDVHGRADLLETAIALIEAHAAGRAARMIFLGDYVDRGPQSRAVVERLMGLQKDGRAICLKGNHEDLMVAALTDVGGAALARWRRCGGQETLRAYGVDGAIDPGAAVPRDHLRWLAGLPLTTADDHRIYVHAGLAPRTAFRDQSEDVCLWIREAFLRAGPRDFDRHIVHGHTPLWAGKPDPGLPELLAHRTNLDTGAFATGRLTIGVFDPAQAGGPIELLTAIGPPASHSRTTIAGPRAPR
ncbi:MAG TPA: metallophosphoesterase family protein [Caulobacteraceae bacterium]